MNTGRKIFQFLKQVNATTMTPTGVVKENLPGDPDYVAPIVDYTFCPIVTWRPITPFCIVNKICAEGWVLEGNVCIQRLQQPANAPTGNGGTPGIAQKVNNVAYNNGGARVYAAGFNSDGSGTVEASLLVPHLWVNGNYVWDSVGRNTTYGRMNASAVWSVSATPNNEFIGFSRKVTTTVAKTYYVGIAGDNVVKIKVNGVQLIEMEYVGGGPNFNYWNIYPINLSAGDNFIEVYGMNLGGDAAFGAEIYDMTLSELQAAATEADLNILFSTQSIVGESFDLGITQGYNCPNGWSLDTSGSGDPVCRKINSSSPTIMNTGYKAWEQRERLSNGVADGLVEDNVDNVGIGPYFAPVQDLTNCPI